MAYELRDQSGSLFKNDKHVTGDSLPSYRGDCMVNGKKMSVSAWVKEGKNGKFFSLAFQEPYIKPEGQNAAQKPAINKDDPFADFDSEIPF
jgi:hypothetical protein